MQKLILIMVIFVCYSQFVYSEAEYTTARKLATINANTYVVENDTTVKRFEYLLNRISSKCTNSKEDIASIFSSNTDMEVRKSEEFNNILAKEMSDLYFDMFQIYKYINKNEVELAVKIEKNFVKKFLINLYKKIYHVNYIITDNDLENFILYLCDHKMLPFTRDELKTYLKQTIDLDLSSQDDLSKATEIYTLLSKGFFDNIQKYLIEHNLSDINIVERKSK